MLPKEHRLTSSRDHRDTMRQGSRAGGGGVLVAVRIAPQRSAAETDPWRCGLVVSKAVGNAVVRHRVQRRLRHVIFDLMRDDALATPEGGQLDMVIRAFPEIVDLDHAQLSAAVQGAAQRALRKTALRRVQQ
ncbi:ribonuclease P protein component [Nesterenkonia sp. Act20]|uniref:ribonuclease P protein component n=1 Tax=Nesterenkonia sp. Act20 TaxID=1483432 RepID=UPI00350E5340